VPDFNGLIHGKVSKAGPGALGKRSIDLRNSPKQINAFPFDSKSCFPQIFKAAYHLDNPPARNQLTLQIPAFEVAQALSIPTGASHYQVHLAALTLSEYKYQDKSDTWNFSNKDQNLIFAQRTSQPINLDSSPTKELQLTVQLPIDKPLNKKLCLIQMLGIQSTQEISGIHYPLKQNSAMMVAGLT